MAATGLIAVAFVAWFFMAVVLIASPSRALAVVLGLIGLVAAGGSLMIDAVRRENQNQRVLGRLDRQLEVLQKQASEREESDAAIAKLTTLTNALPQRIESVLDAHPPVAIAPAGAQTQAAPQTPSQTPEPTKSSDPKIVSRTQQHTTPDQDVEVLEILLDSALPAYESIPLSKQPLKLAVDLKERTSASINLQLLSTSSSRNAKAGLIAAVVRDAAGKAIDFRVLPSMSDAYGNFQYLGTTSFITPTTIEMPLPRHAAQLEFSFYKWSGALEIQNSVSVTLRGRSAQWLSQRPASQVKVAAVLDEFSHNSFEFECDLLNLNPSGWQEQLDAFQPDLFLCESAWSGRDSDIRPWKGRVYASENFDHENRGELLSIVKYCRERGIPTVFWNKEDPTHYGDKVHNFIDTALNFDHIFTTDADLVPRYKEEHGHSSVHALPFAVQPRRFNPIRSGERSSAVIFAGGWYSNHEERSRTTAQMFTAVEQSGRELKVYDRFYGSTDPTKVFPDEFQYALNPPVRAEDMAQVYKESEIGMTVNTVTESSTMFARRIFELMACNSYVVSNYSRGIETMFGDNVLYIDRDPGSLKTLTTAEMDAARAANLDTVLSQHTYKHRMDTILRVAGVPFRSEVSPGAESEPFPLIVACNDSDEAAAAFEQLRRVGDWAGDKVIVLTAEATNLDFADALMFYNREGVSVVYENLLADGQTPMDQVFGVHSGGALTSVADLLRNDVSQREFRPYQLHAQYVDVPVVEADPEAGEAGKYIFDSVQPPLPAWVTPANLLEVLQSRTNGSTTTVYRM